MHSAQTAGGAYRALPDPLAGFQGAVSREGKERQETKGEGMKGREEREKGRGVEGASPAAVSEAGEAHKGLRWMCASCIYTW